MEWNGTFGTASDDWATSLVQTFDGIFVLAGNTESYGAGASDMWLIKTTKAEDTSLEEEDVSGITLDVVVIFLLLGGGLIAVKRR